MILPPSSYLVSFLTDAKRFIPSLNDFIFFFPLQLYSTGLVLAPMESLVRNQFWHERPTEVSKVQGTQAEWDTTLQVLHQATYVTISMLAFSCDGARLASADWAGSIVIYDTSSGIEIISLESVARIDAIVFSPDCTLIAALDERGSMLFWNIHSGRLENCILNCPNLLMTINNEQNNRQVGTQKLDFPDDGRAWDVSAWRMTHITPRLKREGMVTFTAEFMERYGSTNDWFQVFSDDGLTVASPTATSAIAVWDVSSGRLKAKFGWHEDLLCGLLISPNASTIISNAQSVITTHITEKYAWDISSGNRITDFRDSYKTFSLSPASEAFLRHSNKVCFPTKSGIVLWDIDSNEITHAAFEKPGGMGRVISFDDNLYAEVLSGGLGVRIYRPAWKLTVNSYATANYLDQGPSNAPLQRFTISSNGLIALQRNQVIDFQDLRNDAYLFSDSYEPAYYPEVAQFSDNGERVMYKQSAESIIIRNTCDASEAFSIHLHRTDAEFRLPLSFETMSPDGNLIVVSSDHLPVTVYNINSGMVVGGLEEVEAIPDPFHFSPLSNGLIYHEVVQKRTPGRVIVENPVTFLVYFELNGESWQRRWRALHQHFKCFSSDGSRLLTRWTAEDPGETRWEILSTVDGSRLLFVTPTEEVVYMDFPALDWVPISTNMMIPTQATKYLKSRMGYLNTETGKLELTPEATAPVDLLFSYSWLMSNGKSIIFVPESLTDRFPQFGTWGNTAYLLSKDRLIRITMAAPT